MRFPGTVSRPAETIVRQMDFISSVAFVSNVLPFREMIPLTLIEFSCWVFQDVSRDARFV